jgi:AcrR family transcriptional regulator
MASKPTKPPPRPGVSPDTRTTLLETACRLIAKRGVADITLAEIGAAAGVSRQAVYLHFGSRAGLLVAMARHLDATSQAARAMTMAAWEAQSKAGFESFIRLWFEHVIVILPVARAVQAAAFSDKDAHAAWQDRMADLRRAVRNMVDGLAESGQLAAHWTREEATDWFWSRTHFDVWTQLVTERQWPPEQMVKRVSESLWADLTDRH